MAPHSRMDIARRRLRLARRTAGGAAIAGFLAFGLAARASHPGTHTGSAPSSAGTSSTATDQSSANTFDFGGSSIGSSSDRAAVRSSGS